LLGIGKGEQHLTRGEEKERRIRGASSKRGKCLSGLPVQFLKKKEVLTRGATSRRGERRKETLLSQKEEEKNSFSPSPQRKWVFYAEKEKGTTGWGSNS